MQDSLIAKVADFNQELPVRIQAIESLAAKQDEAIKEQLKKLFDRQRPLVQNTVNWDNAGAERVIDWYLIKALHQLGDDHEINRIGTLVANAGTVLKGPYDEFTVAAKVIRTIGKADAIDQVVRLNDNRDEQVVRNAVLVLNNLQLANAPVGGSTAAILPADKHTYKFSRLKQEVQQLVNLSKGKIVLSTGVQREIDEHDYERGDVKLDDRSLIERVEYDISMLNFDYYIEKGHVVICTHAEAGERWKGWWLVNHDAFKFS